MISDFRARKPCHIFHELGLSCKKTFFTSRETTPREKHTNPASMFSGRVGPNDWLCTTCNFWVFASKPSCSKCGSTRPGPESSVTSEQPVVSGGDWKCSQCSATNFAKRDKCFKCDVPRSSSGRDWLCGECKVMNFGKRDKCFKCGVAKNLGPVAAESKRSASE